MIESVDTVSPFIQGAGPAGTSTATLAPQLEPLSPRAADNKPPIESLPNELLANILEYLDSPKPSSSESVLHDEPHVNLTKSNNAPLKAASCVSKRWRRGTIPLLFKHPQLVVEEKKTPWSTLDEMIQPFFDFVGEHQLRRIVQSFTFIVHEEKLANIVNKQEISKGFLSFWGRLFQVIDPQELLVVAPVVALGPLTNCHIYLSDAWSFDCPCHYLRLQMPPRASTRKTKAPQEQQMPPKSGNEASQASGPAAPLSTLVKEEPEEFPKVPLWKIRPWTSLLLNEGSFIRAYATYEFWQRQPPSILPDLVGADIDKPARISPTICDLSYVGLFPMASHFNAFTTNLPKLKRLYVQLVPRNEILQDPTKMAQVEAEDLWMERNSCYALLMRELFNIPPPGNYKYLEEFESGDAADRDAWDMAVEYVKRATDEWKVASDGVFVRDTKEKATVPAAVDDKQKNLAFQGALVRWAWNGIKVLPVSPMPHYATGT